MAAELWGGGQVRDVGNQTKIEEVNKQDARLRVDENAGRLLLRSIKDERRVLYLQVRHEW